jgi:ferredoxin-NADP reductase
MLAEAVGARHQVRITADTLLKALPDIPDRDVFICGPESFTAAVAAECRAAGVPARRIHFESFAF